MKGFFKAALVMAVATLTACSSTTNVYDYYLKNVMDNHRTGEQTTSKSKLLLREFERVNKAQFELVAYKSDSTRYLVIGSHKVAKAFYLHDSLYQFDVADLYSRVRGDDFIRQMGDLSIYFTHIPSEQALTFLDALPQLKTKYASLKPAAGVTEYVDYTIAPDVVVSFSKTSPSQQPTSCVLWIGKRKHTLDTQTLVNAMNQLKMFN